MATAIERVLAFAELKPEAELEETQKSVSLQSEVVANKNVTSSGVLEFRDVNLK